MAAVDVYADDFGGVEHIGPAPHTIRNALVAFALFAMAGLLAFFYWPRGHMGTPATSELTQFREAMYNRCGGEEFAGPTHAKLAEVYADSSKMRGVVVEQFHLLQKDTTKCADVIQALRNVNYPVR